MKIYECIKKYIEFIGTDKFTKYEKDFTSRIHHGLFDAYRERFHEPNMVSIIESVINQVSGLSSSDGKFKISTNSIFIHGTKSQVEFEYYGQKT
ncbi:MAG: hypothetical protein ACP5JH_12150, partial [Bacteroidota bacterium]